MKKNLLVLILSSLIAAPALAADNAFYASATFAGGGLGFGADYERMFDEFGGGGYFRYYQKDDDNNRDGVMAAGAFIRPHFYKKNWDFYVSPGFGFVNIESATQGGDDVSTLGPIFSVGLLYQTSGNVAFGAEMVNIYGWFDEDARSNVMSETSAKVRMTF